MKRLWMLIKETVITLLVALALSLVLRTYVVEARVVPTGSMLPTIQINDRLLVNKFIYDFTTPERGEIIVFAPPEVLSSENDYLKRVIGLPGEVVEVKSGEVFINGVALKESYQHDRPDYNFGPVRVPDNAIFVLGDNRNESYDSHAWGAWLTLDRIKGKAFLRYWPLKHFAMLH
ncbi:signal peptidase I [Metallumcola ferriviriculae]|uniref:Signal peptidase I n=1 Tax=Metallumcola ferriviriculae TaxID=3039180 RepID=A0AAU0UQF8_9FIRM|nr:signal peptidase I [Desulfitibacteraceae bacterium MK1]